jgi:hypothetical protein
MAFISPVDFSYRDRLIFVGFPSVDINRLVPLGADCRAEPKGGQSWRGAQIGGIIYRAMHALWIWIWADR